MNKYDPNTIEPKWQEQWEKEGYFHAVEDPDKEKWYTLIEFPYPSGAGLHVGHVRSYTALDIVSRKKRMQGFNVLYPIGWDAFGLPTENYAIKNKIHPVKATADNVATFKRQIQSIGLSFDWTREVNTTDPLYYKWTQWIFLQLFKAGLAYQDEIAINWCPSCRIGLANEEVVEGKCERCGGETTKKMKEQWMLKITEYAQRLIDDLETVDYLPQIAHQQVNWIGRSDGADIDFKVKSDGDAGDKTIRVFTTRPDTLYGATYMVLAPEHELVDGITTEEQREAVEQYKKQAAAKSELERTELEKEKTGVFTGAYAVNPVNGREIPVWIADYVLASYGTGAIMAVPAHDQRDFEFAQQHSLPIFQVVKDEEPKEQLTIEHFNTLLELRDALKNEGAGLILVGGFAREAYTGSEQLHTDFDIYVKEGDLEKVEAFCKEKGWKFAEHDHPAFDFTAWYGSSSDDNMGIYFDVMVLKEDGGKFVDETVNGRRFEWGAPSVVEEHEVRGEKFRMPNEVLLGSLYQYLARGLKEADENEGWAVNSPVINHMPTVEAKEKMTQWLEDEGIGKRAVQYKLRDWVFSRQRYWGEPIPIIHCEQCGTVAVPEDQLPVELPEVEEYEPTDTGESPLAKIEDWVNTECPECGGAAQRETDVMPNWAGSSWYWLRYTDPKNDAEFAGQEKLNYWTPVDLYSGGMEHTTLHLLYSRFWHKFLYDKGLVPTSEPYMRRRAHGMVLAQDGKKMSKSLGNVINPDDIVEQFGADTLRVYEMFMGPFDEAISWNENGVKGISRFLDRVWIVSNRIIDEVKKDKLKQQKEPSRRIEKTIKKVTEDIDEMKFNTAVAQLMIFFNGEDNKPDWRNKLNSKGEWETMKDAGKQNEVDFQALKKFIVLLSVFAPHMSEELWQRVDEENTSITQEPWPTWNDELVTDETVEVAVQVNGKTRDTIMIAPDAEEGPAKKAALASEKISNYIEGAEVVKTIYVPGKIINLVVK